jgi:hypothetical protein
MVLKFSGYFSSRAANVGRVVVKVAMRQIFLQVSEFFPTNIIPPILFVQFSLTYHQYYLFSATNTVAKCTI